MNKLEIVRGAESNNVNWLLNGEYNFHMTKDAFAGLVGQLQEFRDSDAPYMVANLDVENDAVDDMESLQDIGEEA